MVKVGMREDNPVNWAASCRRGPHDGFDRPREIEINQSKAIIFTHQKAIDHSESGQPNEARRFVDDVHVTQVNALPGYLLFGGSPPSTL